MQVKRGVKKMFLYQLANTDKVYRYNRCILVPFGDKRKVMSTSMHNGGYRENLKAVFNQDVNPGLGKSCPYLGKDRDTLVRNLVETELGFSYEQVAYMATIVSMDNVSIVTEKYDVLEVTAIVTASLEVNGGRVCEPATSYEKDGQSVMLKPGTINIMVFVNQNMTEGCLARSMITATEAKTAALQELLAGSIYSTGLATGSGTDNLMVIADATKENPLTYAGKHGKLGELIGKTVKQGVKESLDKHMGLSKNSQNCVFARLKRFGITERDFYQQMKIQKKESLIPAFSEYLYRWGKDPFVVAQISLLAHLFDQLEWGLLEEGALLESAVHVIKGIAEKYHWNSWSGEWKEDQEIIYLKVLRTLIRLMCTEYSQEKWEAEK